MRCDSKFFVSNERDVLRETRAFQKSGNKAGIRAAAADGNAARVETSSTPIAILAERLWESSYVARPGARTGNRMGHITI